MSEKQLVHGTEKSVESSTHGACENRARLDELSERYLQLASDFENLKRRTREEADRIATKKADLLVLGLLPVVDNLSRALKSATPDATALRAGVGLTLKNFRQVLREHGYEPDDCLHQKFDPRRQESIGSRSLASYSDQAVLEVVQEGWLRSGELLRPARVIINDLGGSPMTDVRE